jgi:hypothetical protein
LIRKKRIVSHRCKSRRQIHAFEAGAMFGELSLAPSPLAGEIAIIETALR